MVVAALWGVSWVATTGLVSGGYAALAAASAIAAGAFHSLAPGAPAAAAAAASLSTTTTATTSGATGAAAAAAAVASVDWVDVALRTAAGMAGGGVGEEQVLQALQDAAAGPVASWAVRALLPALCAVATGCRAAALALQTGLPWLGPLAQLAGAAAGLGVLLVMAAPLRPYLAPLIRVLPGGRLRPSTHTALRAGGVACMVALLTRLQAHELRAPALGPSVRSTAAAVAAASPLQPQHQAVLYGILEVASDVLLPVCTAAVAGWVARELLTVQRREGQRSEDAGAGKTEAQAAAAAAAAGSGSQAAVESVEEVLPGAAAALRAVRGVAAGRLLLDALALVAVLTGQLSGTVSAVKLLGMLWLLQTAQHL